MKKKQSKIHSLREGQDSLPGFNTLSGQGEDVTASPASGEDLQLAGTVRKSVPDAKQAANRTPQLLPETMGQDPKDAGDIRRSGTGRSKHVIASRTEFAHLVFELRCSLEDHPERWPNGSLISFLDALATFVVEGGDDRYSLPEWTDWETFSEILLAAKTYGS
jgi:hypothetical protein